MPMPPTFRPGVASFARGVFAAVNLVLVLLCRLELSFVPHLTQITAFGATGVWHPGQTTAD